MNIVIPMAGAGSRFVDVGIDIPKPLIEVLGNTLIEHAIKSFDVEGRFIFITRDYGKSYNNTLSTILKTLRPESIEIKVSSVTSGAVESVLRAQEFIDNDDSLVVYNCDQKIEWDPYVLLNHIKNKDPSALLVLYKSTNPKNSFAEISDDNIVRVAEKNPISDNALIGFHYWKHGSDFCTSANKLMDHYRSSGSPECYVSETYNYLYKKINAYFIANNVYVPLGTPEDVSKFVGKEREYNENKPKTLFIDIDGTISKHQHAISGVYQNTAEVLPGVIKKFDEWDSAGYRIILTTGRKESTRAVTEKQLEEMQISYDMLIMGVGSGTRVIINDKLNTDMFDRAVSINVITDNGFENVDWEKHGL